jgi:hypothetical protein
MVFLEISDGTQRASLASFLDARFGGSLWDRDAGIEFDFRLPALSPEVELRLVERLLRAWRAQEQPQTEVDVTLTASPSGTLASDRPRGPSQRRLRL